MIECEEVVVLGIYKKIRGKICSMTNSLRFQTKVGKLATLAVVLFYVLFLCKTKARLIHDKINLSSLMTLFYNYDTAGQVLNNNNSLL